MSDKGIYPFRYFIVGCAKRYFCLFCQFVHNSEFLVYKYYKGIIIVKKTKRVNN